jgi:hypothetical protein
MSAAAFLDATHAELARLELELVRTGDRMTALKLLLSSYVEDGETAPKRLPAGKRTRRPPGRATQPRPQRPAAEPTTRQAPPSAPRAPSWDVDAARRLREDQGLSFQEIRDRLRLPVTGEAVRYHAKAHGWATPARSAKPGPKTRHGGARIPATDCPQCAKRTTRNPCEGCGTQLAPGEVGKRRQGQR